MTWAWADVQDCKHGNILRVTAYACQAQQLVDMGFLLNYKFLHVRCEPGSLGPHKCFLQKGSAVIQADAGLDADIEWDRREYGALKDIASGLSTRGSFDFIVRLVKEKAFHNEYIVAEFIDEEGTVADLRVDQGFKVFLRPGSTYVIHRAKFVEHAGTVDASAMFAFSPCGYKWTPT